jgi:homoserine kinase
VSAPPPRHPTTPPPQRVRVRVPASTTNLGPGFDTLGLALALHNRIGLELSRGPVRVEISGEGAGVLETDERNLAYRAAQRLYRELGRETPGLRVRLENAIPVSRGLGSSSTAIVGGLLAANALAGEPLDREALLRLAVEMEGHPDNVTPALLGGFQVTSLTPEGLIHLRIPTPAGLRAVVCIPDLAVSTAEARAVLPAQYSRDDAVFNLGRVALLVAGLLTGQTDVLRPSMEDRIHQPYRARLVPGFEAAVRAALEAGAAGACLSGSGSTILALTAANEAAVGGAMTAAVRAAGVESRWLALDVDDAGAVVEEQ